MSSKNTHQALMSGQQFVRFVKQELEKQNSGLGKVTLRSLSELSGYSPGYLRNLLTAEDPNPSAKAMRCFLLTLGVSIESPEQDVIPHLKAKGVYCPRVHGASEGVS
ncbi:hypothetical protein [Falsiruegeria mediterranea]|uniref:HTH cro/C1-type domain-containing protein n=1 Tax=Falsiruegeria mediterranea M17 TaxID=1200281 RepID=A0A2R8CEY3_9RHOB|nr:hypothetical protein [Falsiruegeria mediterranea]SPJ30976.1 hypothetical protein TRM7615_04513 [Falsiruegeria mediterranea M17]